MKSKKKRRTFETYNRYSCFANEEQKKGKVSDKNNLVGGGNNFFNFFKGGNFKKSF